MGGAFDGGTNNAAGTRRERRQATGRRVRSTLLPSELETQLISRLEVGTWEELTLVALRQPTLITLPQLYVAERNGTGTYSESSEL